MSRQETTHVRILTEDQVKLKDYSQQSGISMTEVLSNMINNLINPKSVIEVSTEDFKTFEIYAEKDLRNIKNQFSVLCRNNFNEPNSFEEK